MPKIPPKTASKSKSKSTSKSRSAVKPAPRSARKKSGAAARATVVELSQLPELAGLLVTARRKDLEAVTDATKKSYAGLQVVVQRQVELLKNAVSEWRLVIKLMAEGGARESLSKLDELAVAAFKMALADIRELADMTARSQAEAYDIVSRRIREDVDEATRLLEHR